MVGEDSEQHRKHDAVNEVQRLPREEQPTGIGAGDGEICVEVASPVWTVDPQRQSAVEHWPRKRRQADRWEDVTEVRPELGCNHTDNGESADRMCSNPVVPAL